MAVVISMGKNLGERVIAEAVDTDEQLAFPQARQRDDEDRPHFSDALSAEGSGPLRETRQHR